MRFRAPLLYEQYIGQYLTQEELSARAPAHQPPKPGALGTPACPLSDLLLQSYQERELQQRLLQQQEEEEAGLEEEEEEEDSDEEGEGRYQGAPSWLPTCKSRPHIPPLPALSAQALPSPSSISVPHSSKACSSCFLQAPAHAILSRMPSLRHPPGISS